jgi:hypothetical protein
MDGYITIDAVGGSGPGAESPPDWVLSDGDATLHFRGEAHWVAQVHAEGLRLTSGAVRWKTVEMPWEVIDQILLQNPGWEDRKHGVMLHDLELGPAETLWFGAVLNIAARMQN